MEINSSRQILKGGVTYYEIALPRSEAVTLIFGLRVGSRYEKNSLAGISHFLEHLFFKGTKRRPTSLAIASELDALGASYNAFTAQEATAYYVSSAAAKFGQILDVLSDMLLNPIFPAAELEKERQVIVEEINMYEDMPQSKVGEIAARLIFGRTPLGRPITGTKETIKALSREQIHNFYQKYYHAGNLVTVVAGNPRGFDWGKAIASALAPLKKLSAPGFEAHRFEPTEPQVEILGRKTDQTHLVLGVRAFNRYDPDYPALLVLNIILGGLMSSRLFEEVREKRGLAYYIRSQIDEYLDTAALIISSGVTSERLELAVKVIIAELGKLADKSITAGELKKAKDNFEGTLALQLETSRDLAWWTADSEFWWKRVRQPQEFLSEVKAVTASDVKRVAGRIFQSLNLSLAVVGPMRHHKNKDRIRKILEV